MSATPFKVGGALTDEHSAVYVERQPDRDALTHLRAMDYLLVIEPRQQGKTSLINHLRSDPSLNGYKLLYIYFTTPDRTNELRWYKTIGQRLLSQLYTGSGWAGISLPEDSFGWRVFLGELAEQARQNNQHVVIALDEISVVPLDWSEAFFSVLRDVHNSRIAEPEFRSITFLLVGTYDPRDLIKDDKISPFNIAHRVRLLDFTMPQVRNLVGQGEWPDEQAAALTERIHYWTDGQPYLTQLLCYYLGPDATPADVNAGVERLRREDRNHLAPLLKRLNSDEKLRGYVERILTGERIKFYAGENRRQAQLELVGVLKADEDGYCRIRNRIYELALYPHDNRTSSFPVPVRESDVSMDIPRELIEQLGKGNVVIFCGAGISVSDGGIPSGGQLAKELSERAETGDVGSMTLPEVAQAYELEMEHQSLIAFIAERIEGADHAPLRTHQLIAILPLKCIITTNWDTLLEEALRQAGKPTAKIVRDQDVAYVDEEKVTLIKLHGSIDQKDTIVVTGDDYYDVFARLPETANLVRGYFATKTLLFLGYGLADEDFKRLYYEVEHHLGKHKRRAYAVQLNPTALAVKYWQQKNVQVIAADATAFLEALAAQLNVANPSPGSRQAIQRETPGTAQSTVHPVGGGQTNATVVKENVDTPTGRGDMNYGRGLDALKQLAQGTGWYQDFAVHEAALRENLRDEGRYGPSEQTRRDRTRVVEQLNGLALERIRISFNDLCMGKQPTASPLSLANNDEIIARLHRIEEKIDYGRAEDRETAAQLLDAIAQNRIEQVEANRMMADLQAWGQKIEQDGLPLSPELRSAVDALTEHSGSAYQYLQVALPIIPGILTYNVELGSQHQADLKALWERMKARFGR